MTVQETKVETAPRVESIRVEPAPRQVPLLDAVRRAPGRAFLWTRWALGRTLSVRWKLTLWYGLMCLLTLGLVGFGMRTVLDIQIKASIDNDLRQTAQDLAPVLAHSGAYGTRSVPCGHIQQYCDQVQYTLNQNANRLARPGQFEQVLLYSPNFDPSIGYPLLVPNSAPRGLGISVPLDILGAAFQHPIQHTFLDHGKTFRAYLVPITLPPRLQKQGVQGVLEIFQIESTYLTIQHDLDLILVIGIPLGVLIALVAGWWIARAALRPINRISRTVQTIGESRDLTRRLDFIGPVDEVGRLAYTFDGMMDRLERLFEAQKRFIADASHELRTPLTTIRGNADLFAIAPPDEREQCISSIRREAERMSRMVGDLLLLAEADLDEQPIHRRQVDLAPLLMDLYNSAQLIAADKVSVHFEPIESVTVQGDPDRLKQVVLNLVDNAVKFTPKGGEVTVSLMAQPGGALISVHDTGVGIPPHEQEAIFRRFYRVEESRSTRGSGLGLAICSWIVQAHGGRVDLRSAPGEGSTFSIWLPGQ